MPNRAKRRALKFADRLLRAQQAESNPTTAAAVVAADAVPPENTVVMTAAAGAAPAPIVPVISDAKLMANRANAQKSHGPVTPEGRQKVSLNALKTGLTGQTVLLPSDDLAAYQAHVDRHFKQFAPKTDQEHTLVQFLADTEWRLLRISPLESAIWAQGRRELADLHAEEKDPLLRDGLIKLAILNTYRKDLNNLALQERRLRNHYKSDLERLQTLQKERTEKARDSIMKMSMARDVLRNFKAANQPWDPAHFGFEFSIEEIEHYAAEFARVRPLAGRAPEVEPVIAAFRKAQLSRE